MAHLFASIRPTCIPGTIRKASGMLVIPLWAMSSWLITKIAEAASETFSGRLEKAGFRADWQMLLLYQEYSENPFQIDVRQ